MRTSLSVRLNGCFAIALILAGIWGCKHSSRVANRPDAAAFGGQVGNPDARIIGGGPEAGGSYPTGGTGGVATGSDAAALADRGGTPLDVPSSKRDDGAVDVPASTPSADDGSTGSGGATPIDGMAGAGGTTGIGGAVTTGGASGDAGQGGADAAETSGGLSMFCTTDQDCPSDSRCCNGSDPTCDGTRLPSGDRANAGEFVVSADGLTVTDTITGLVWQRDGSGARPGCSGEGNLRCTWNEAQAYCASLTLGGFDDWRLPGWNELVNTTDLTTDGSTPPLDPSAFPGTPMEGFWTSSRRLNTSCSGEMYLNFTNVTLGMCATQDLRVRCVRGSRCYPKSRFVVLDAEKDVDGAQVRDTLTGLVWQQLVKTPAPECVNWTNAQIYCASLGQGFRLPTFKEELSLFGPEMRVDWTLFSPTRCDYTWTSTPYGGSDATLTGYARCPRESSLDPGQNWLEIRPRYGVRCVR